MRPHNQNFFPIWSLTYLAFSAWVLVVRKAADGPPPEWIWKAHLSGVILWVFAFVGLVMASREGRPFTIGDRLQVFLQGARDVKLPQRRDYAYATLELWYKRGARIERWFRRRLGLPSWREI